MIVSVACLRLSKVSSYICFWVELVWCPFSINKYIGFFKGQLHSISRCSISRCVDDNCVVFGFFLLFGLVVASLIRIQIWLPILYLIQLHADRNVACMHWFLHCLVSSHTNINTRNTVLHLYSNSEYGPCFEQTVNCSKVVFSLCRRSIFLGFFKNYLNSIFSRGNSYNVNDTQIQVLCFCL